MKPSLVLILHVCFFITDINNQYYLNNTTKYYINKFTIINN